MTIHPKSSLEKTLDQMLSGVCVQDVYVVSDDGMILGHLSHKRLAGLLLVEHRPIHTRRQLMERVVVGVAEEIMSGEFVFARPDEELDDVLHRFVEHDLQDMPVLDTQGFLVGGINLNTVLREILKKPTVVCDQRKTPTL